MSKVKESVLDKFYDFMNMGFDSNMLTIDKVVGTKVYYNLCAKNYIYDSKTNEVIEDEGESKIMSGRILTTKRGNQTDIFHSYPYFKATAKQRSDLAFNKQALGELTERDKLLMRGYGQRIIEESQAFKYKNPDYVRKTTGNPKATSTRTLKNHFFAE